MSNLTSSSRGRIWAEAIHTTQCWTASSQGLLAVTPAHVIASESSSEAIHTP